MISVVQNIRILSLVLLETPEINPCLLSAYSIFAKCLEYVRNKASEWTRIFDANRPRSVVATCIRRVCLHSRNCAPRLLAYCNRTHSCPIFSALLLAAFASRNLIFDANGIPPYRFLESDYIHVIWMRNRVSIAIHIIAKVVLLHQQ